MGSWGVGMPAALYLEEYGSQLISAFNEIPYLVGSVLKTTKFRDVDIRIILPDKKFKIMGFGKPGHEHLNSKWVAYCMAFSELGKRMTGLPIDFQIQEQTYANKNFSLCKNHPRSALGLIGLRMKGIEND